MTVSIDRLTSIITVEKSDMNLIQIVPSVIYELDLNWFRLKLKDLEDDAGGIPFLKTHDHNTQVTVGGVTLARVVEILEPYTVEFENDFYAVNLIGANSNVGDKVQVNNVSVRSANSAGLVTSDGIIALEYQGGICIDINSSYSGTVYPVGTLRQPVNNLVDAVAIAGFRGFGKLFILESMSLDSGTDISNFEIIGRSLSETVIDIDINAICDNITIRNCTVSGTLDGGTNIIDCVVGDITYFNGHIHNSSLYGAFYLAGSESALFADCKTIDQDNPPIIDMGGSGQDLAIPNYSGIITIKNLSAASEEIGVGLDAGMVILDSTITAGTIIVSGVGILQDNSTGTAVVNIDGLISKETISAAVWDEDVITHTTENTTGYEMLKSAYEKGVHVHEGGGSGTSFPYGTEDTPVGNIADAIAIASLYRIHVLHIGGAINILATDDVSGFTLIADRSLGNIITVTSGATTAGTYFENLTVSGVMGGSVRYTTSVLGAISNFDGGAKNCLITDTIVVTGSSANYFTDCDTYVTDYTATKEISLNSSSVNLIRCRGSYKITNKTSSDSTAIDLVAGVIQIDSTCVAGFIGISGIAEVVDNSGAGCTVFVNSMSHDAISENVWDEPLTASIHNVPTSAGKRLRALTSMVIRNELAQGAGINDNQIQFDVDASSLDGAYDPSVVSIIAGTGSGQTRLVLQYDGSTRMATVDRTWKVNPDSTSEYIIIADAGREHVNEGLAQGGTSTTITLNVLASSQDNAYNGQVVFIRSGTGEDQARRVIAYNGTTKIATVGSAFPVTPDTTSGYVILPTGTISHKMIADAVWDADKADHIVTDTFGVILSDVAKLTGNKVAKSGNVITIYEDDGVTIWRQYDLTDGGRVEL